MNPVRRVLERFELTNRRHRLVQKKDRILLAVSGGADSMALLGIFLILKKKFALTVVAAHLDHGLQRNAGKSLRVVRDACQKAGVRLIAGKTKVKALAERKKLSVEDAARQARYAFLVAAAKRTGSRKIATAHHRDDQAETVLMRVLRGAGVRGIAGIPYRRDESGKELIRPFLDTTKKELAAAARALGHRPVEDPMNKDVRFLRSKIRHSTLPHLRKINPVIDESLANLQAVHAELRAYLAPKVRAAYRSAVLHSSKKELRLSAARLRRLPSALRNETLLEALAQLKGDLTGFAYPHVRAMADLLDSAKKEAQTHLPHGVKVFKKGDRLHLRIP